MTLTPLDLAAARKAFDRAAHSYDLHAVLQQEVGRRLLERVAYFELEPAVVLDLGCGTGAGSVGLVGSFPLARVLGIDWSKGMLGQARQRVSGHACISLVCANMVQLPLAARSADLVFSNLAMGWCPDPLQLFNEIRRVLKPGGLFLFTSYGPDSLTELRSAWAQVDSSVHVHDFADIRDVGDLLVSAGFQDPVMDVERITLNYGDVPTLMRELKAIGAQNVAVGRTAGLTGKSKLAEVVRAYGLFRQDEQYPANFEVVYGATFAPAEGKPRRTSEGELAEFSVESLLRSRRS